MYAEENTTEGSNCKLLIKNKPIKAAQIVLCK